MSKNYKGGYKLISLDKVDVESMSVGVTIKGIHEAIESSYGKAFLLTAIVIGGVEKNDVYVGEIKVVDGKFVFKAYGYEITINDDDEVEAVEIPQSEELDLSMFASSIVYEEDNNVSTLNVADDYEGQITSPCVIEDSNGHKIIMNPVDDGSCLFIAGYDYSYCVIKSIKKLAL